MATAGIPASEVNRVCARRLISGATIISPEEVHATITFQARGEAMLSQKLREQNPSSTLARATALSASLCCVAAVAVVASMGSALTQSYPSRPIKIIVPYGAGGPSDTITRIVGERMRTALGQPVIIDNVSGAAGRIGTGQIARAAPDGYTVGHGSIGTHVVNGGVYSLNYDVLKDFEPVSLLADTPQMIVARKTMPANDLREFIAWLKANPDRASQGTGGIGSLAHLAGILFQERTGAHFQFVPYRGTAMADLVAGNIDFMIDQTSNALPQVRSGAI